MKIYAIVNQKGGVGKTTSVISLAACLAEQHRVLIVDIDPQGNATSGLGFDRCDIGVVTNVTEDHLGLRNINTLEDMALFYFVRPLIFTCDLQLLSRSLVPNVVACWYKV